jgi:UDP-N-acetylglucosamine--N-acetylmuramyl-(pentapeptide) pyrophosphoryl-undecaprenol N-acetylglucosamine transferase
MKNKKIMLAGGGTGGSVTPLLALGAYFKEVDFVFVGTKQGVEKEMVAAENIKFISIASGKLRRYFSFKNFSDIFKIILGFFQSFVVLKKERPDIIVSAGGFVAVPLVWAAALLRIPILIHQQDIRAGLANKLMAPFARTITVTFTESLKDYGQKAILIGNPTKDLKLVLSDEAKVIIQKKYNLNNEQPLVLVVGGGTGSSFINNLVAESLNELGAVCQIIHVTGHNKKVAVTQKNYQQFELMPHDDLLQLEFLAEVVVSRCGLGALTELSFLGKPSILIPMPDSHQEDNAAIFSKNKAGLVLHEAALNSEIFGREVKDLLSDGARREEYAANIKKVIKSGATEALVEIIKKIVF